MSEEEDSPYIEAAKVLGSEAMMSSYEPEEPIEHPSFTRAKALPEPWRSHFPKSVEEAKLWLPEIRRVALDRTVLLVAKTRIECAWAAYARGVPGNNHDAEEILVVSFGGKMTEKQARFFFPEFERIPYAR